MLQTQYLIVGASHAALAALQAIRMHDPDGSITVVSKDDTLPYSPTVLPYVVSGRSDPQRVFLRDHDYFDTHRVDYLKGVAVSAIDPATQQAELSDGRRIAYAKLLLASGAAPQLPPLPGLERVRFHVLRSLDDALALRDALGRTRRALVLGAGLVGMHAAENLAKAGAEVTVVEMQERALAAYFDQDAAAIIEARFAEQGVHLRMGRRVTGVAPDGDGVRVALDDGSELAADLLLVATGVTPVTAYLCDSGVDIKRGVVVDDSMRTSVANIWAAGDVAEASGFYDGAKRLNGILPDAVEQGKIAGMDMAGDPALSAYRGSIPLNTYTFFGQQAVSVGSHEGEVVLHEADRSARRYLKIVMRQGRLTGIFGINRAFDPGIMWELIRRKIDLGPIMTQFLAEPQRTARVLMSKTWR